MPRTRLALADRRSPTGQPGRRLLRVVFFPLVLFSLLSIPSSALGPAPSVDGQSARSASWGVTIVLPAKIVARDPVTLAVLGVDGRLVPGVTVELGDGRQVTTDRTGRAFFNGPSAGGILLARASGASAAALIDAVRPAPPLPAIAVAPEVSLRDRFSICGSGLRGNSDENRLRINGEPALVIAASPECLVVLPKPEAMAGPATISIDVSGMELRATTTLVSLDFEPPDPPLVPDKKGRLVVRARGSQERLRILVDNQTPAVVRFLGRDGQELLTSGGPQNSATVGVQAIRSGDFSFQARLLPAPDASIAIRYLGAAEPLAPKDLRQELSKLTGRLAHHPRDIEQARRVVEQMISVATAGDFRTLLEAAHAAL
jgi:hypothetical protein